MSQEGIFQIEEDDIVRLDPTRDAVDEKEIVGRSGWVNVGTYAVKIQLSSCGDLNVTIHPRTAEGHDLASISVTRQDALDADGVDPDQDPALADQQ